MKKFLKFLPYCAIIFLTAIFEISFIRPLQFPFNNWEITLSVAIYLAVVFNLNMALWWALIAGFVLDFFSLLPYGSIIISLIITVFVIHYLFINLFTNRSVYSLIFLGAIGTIIYKLLIFGASFLPLVFGKGNQIFFFNMNLLKILIASIVLNLLLLIIMFELTNVFSKRLKPQYLRK